MQVLSRILSWVFLPLNAPVISLLVALYIPSFVASRDDLFSYPDNAKHWLLIVFSFFSIVIPGFVILFLRFSGVITTVMMDNRRERILPSLFVNGSAVALYFLLRTKDADQALSTAIYGLSMGSTLTVLLCTIVTRWWKISLHAAGMGILSGFVLAYYSQAIEFEILVVVAVLLASGMVMSARLYLQKHTLAQCLCGYAVGTIATASSVIALNPNFHLS